MSPASPLKRREIVGVNFITGFNLELFIVNEKTWGLQNAIRTGSSLFSHRLVTNKITGFWDDKTQQRYSGFLPNEFMYVRGHTQIKRGDEIISLPEEADVFDLIFGKWIIPEERAAYAEAR